jgi:urease accessory protein
MDRLPRFVAGPGSDPTALLRLFHLVSPALPVGAYAYSQGLEYAVHAGWVQDESSALDWLRGLSRHALATLDLPILLRLVRAWELGDRAALASWTAHLMAARETSELRAEELHLGRALARILGELGLEDASSWRESRPAFATMFALAAVRWGIGASDAMRGYLWTWTENQVLAAVRLVPLGQTAGQRLLHQLTDDMPELLARAQGTDDAAIGSSAAAQWFASAAHETQYTRLFRS